MSTPPVTTGRPDDLAYLDSLAGLIPVKVLRVDDEGRVWARVTANHGAYRRGQIVTARPNRMVPRTHIRIRDGQYRVFGLWEWVNR